MIAGKLPTIKRFFDKDANLQSIQVPITYDGKRLIAYRNKYCKRADCVYDQSQVFNRQKGRNGGQPGGTRTVILDPEQDNIFWCNICRNTIDPQEFVKDEELQRIIDNVWNQVDELAKNPNMKIECKRAQIFRDGTWEPVFTQNVRGTLVRRTTAAINKARVLPSLENRSNAEFKELYEIHLNDQVIQSSKYDELVSIALFPHPIRPEQGKREVTAYFKLSFIHQLARQYKLEILHGNNFRMKIGKDLMRTFVKYLENQGLSTLKTQRRYYIMGFEAMKNEQGGKQEKFKYYFFDKSEVLEKYHLSNYDDILCIFKFKDQWYGSIWRILENELNLVDFKANSDASLSTVPQLVRDFHAKFFDCQPPSKGVVLLPDNYSYRVAVEKKDDDCGDLVMGFMYFYSIGSLLFEIKLTPPKRANFSLAFAWMLLKIYHEEEYMFRRNILSAKPKRLELSYVNKTLQDKSNRGEGSNSDGDEGDDQSDYIKEGSGDNNINNARASSKRYISNSNNEDSEEQDGDGGFDFADLLDGGGKNIPTKRQSVFKEQVRYTPMPKKPGTGKSAKSDQTRHAEDENNEDYRKKTVRSATKSHSQFKPLVKQNIIDSKDIEPYEFESSIYSIDTHNKNGPSFNQQRLRSGNSRLNSNVIKDDSSIDSDGKNEWKTPNYSNKQKNRGMIASHLFTNSSSSPTIPTAKQQQQSGLIQPQTTTTMGQQEDKKSLFSQAGLKSLVPYSTTDGTKGQSITKKDLENFRKDVVQKEIERLQKQYVKKEDILDILQDVRQEVNIEMRLEMRKLGEDIKFEREKKAVEEELRKSHFESYFMFLLDYYQKNDLKQYYQLLEEYNARLRGMTIANLPTRHPFALQPFQEQPGFNVDYAQQFSMNPAGNHSHVVPRQGGLPPFTVTASAEQKLKDGFFNRGTMKYNSGVNKERAADQNILYENGLVKIEPKYLAADNNFKNGNLKAPKPGEFRSPGVNGFAISPEVAQSYKDRVNTFMADSIKIVQDDFDTRQAAYKEQIRVAKIMKSMEKYNSNPESGMRLFGNNAKNVQEKIGNQIDQERKHQDLVKQMKHAPPVAIAQRRAEPNPNLRTRLNPVLDEFGSAMPLLVKMSDVTTAKKKTFIGGNPNNNDDD